MARTKQTAVRSTGASAPTKSIKDTINSSLVTTNAHESQVIYEASSDLSVKKRKPDEKEMSTAGKRARTQKRIVHKEVNTSLINISQSLDLCCSVCASGGRILETCSGDNGQCPNAVCVRYATDDDNKVGICNWDATEWYCPHHGGNQSLQVDATVRIDIQSVELPEFAKLQTVELSVRCTFNAYRNRTICFASHMFNNASALTRNSIDIAARWRTGTSRWLAVITHSNNNGDLWFEVNADDSRFAAPVNEFLEVLLGKEDGPNRSVNLVLFVCGSAIMPKGQTTQQNLQTNFKHITEALKSNTTGKVLMFTAHNLEPRNVISDVMKTIEQHELASVSLPQAVRNNFRHRVGSTSPVWVFVDGAGTYVHPLLAPCSKHPTAQKIGGRCVYIESGYQVNVTKCNNVRI